jgi:hypothetical protein
MEEALQRYWLFSFSQLLSLWRWRAVLFQPDSVEPQVSGNDADRFAEDLAAALELALEAWLQDRAALNYDIWESLLTFLRLWPGPQLLIDTQPTVDGRNLATLVLRWLSKIRRADYRLDVERVGTRALCPIFGHLAPIPILAVTPAPPGIQAAVRRPDNNRPQVGDLVAKYSQFLASAPAAADLDVA